MRLYAVTHLHHFIFQMMIFIFFYVKHKQLKNKIMIKSNGKDR